MITQDKIFIGGEWVDSSSSTTIDVISPAREDVYAQVPDGTPEDMDRAIAAARAAFDEGPWRFMSPKDRAEVLDEAARIFETRTDEMAKTITEEMGCPISYSEMAQVPFPIANLHYYAELTRDWPWEEVREDGFGSSVVLQEPVGVVLGIVPWNFPFFTSMNKITPAIASGCSFVFKPSPEAPLIAYIVAKVFEEAGLPPGVLNVVPAGRETGEYAVTHPGVDKVSFTGSTAAGRRIASLCGERIRRYSLELGGKSAAIVLDDADIEEMMPGLVGYALGNTGQVCTALTRVVVSKRRAGEVIDALVDAVSQLPIGDPLAPETFVGPLVTSRQRDRVEGYIEIGKDEGARLATGGGRPAGLDRGWFVEPTVFTGVEAGMRIAQEEIFGPVLSVLEYEDEAEALRVVNDSEYGLAGAVWTGDPAHGLDIARRVRTGTYMVNGAPQALAGPFGGYKMSGIGRELGPEGMNAYVEIKSIAMPTG